MRGLIRLSLVSSRDSLRLQKYSAANKLSISLKDRAIAQRNKHSVLQKMEKIRQNIFPIGIQASCMILLLQGKEESSKFKP